MGKAWSNNEHIVHDHKKVNPSSIIIAREMRGFTQSELARLLKLTQGKVSKMEMGIQGIPSEVIDDLAKVLNFPKEFFYNDIEYYRGLSLHRKRIKATKKEISRIDALTNLMRFHLFQLLSFAEIELNLPSLYSEEENISPRDIATRLRAYWKLPNGPIKNMTKLLEDNGIFIVNLDFNTNQIDGLSVKFPDIPPVIFLNTQFPGDRLRFTLAHELGHLILHSYPTDMMEEEANEFASEFLMPEKDILPYLKKVSIESLGQLKRYWKVSMAALLMRAKQLMQITERQYRYLWMKMSQLGYKTYEPIQIDQEQPSLLRELIHLYIEELEYSFEDLQSLLLLNAGDLKKYYLQHIKDSEFNLRVIK